MISIQDSYGGPIDVVNIIDISDGVKIALDKGGNSHIVINSKRDCSVYKYDDTYAAGDRLDGDLFVSSKYIENAIEILEKCCFDIRFRITDNKEAIIHKFNEWAEVHTIRSDDELLDMLDVRVESLPIIASIWKNYLCCL